MLMTLLNKFGNCSKHNGLDTVPTPPSPPSRMWSVSLYPWPQAPRARQLPCSSEDPKGAGSDRGEQLHSAQGLLTCCPLPFVREIKTSPLLLAFSPQPGVC